MVLPKAVRDLAELAEGAGPGARLGQTTFPHRQEPVPAQESARSRVGQEHRAAGHAIRYDQSGDCQEDRIRNRIMSCP
jgi:hypothetical protein